MALHPDVQTALDQLRADIERTSVTRGLKELREAGVITHDQAQAATRIPLDLIRLETNQ